MNNFKTIIESPSQVVISATCQYIYENKIINIDWLNVLHKFKLHVNINGFNFKISDIQKELDKSQQNLNYPSNFITNFQGNSFSKEEVFINAVDWLANVNINSSKILSVQNKKTTMRNMLANNILKVRSYIKDSNNLNYSNNGVIDFALDKFNYLNPKAKTSHNKKNSFT